MGDLPVGDSINPSDSAQDASKRALYYGKIRMSVGFSGFDLPPPTDWQQFERLCRDLWASIWDDPDTQMHGRGGQEQAGVDVYGQPRAGDGYSAIQCKRKGNVLDNAEISERELRKEVTKAKSFTPLLKGEFILAFTGKRDAKIQAVARAITEEHQAAGLFKVIVYSWEDIQERLGEHAHVVAKHYAALAALPRHFAHPRSASCPNHRGRPPTHQRC